LTGTSASAKSADACGRIDEGSAAAAMNGVTLSSLRLINTSGGNVMHALKSSDPSFAGFGEAYFSVVHHGAVKGWKRHRRMTMNLVVCVGRIRLVLHDDRPQSPTAGSYEQHILSPDTPDSYARLTVPPGIWTAFQGVGEGMNLLLNIANIEHDPAETEGRELDAISWQWD
jgi:dTDP-4-dehydrorhamnose 3,5-epimerase